MLVSYDGNRQLKQYSKREDVEKQALSYLVGNAKCTTAMRRILLYLHIDIPLDPANTCQKYKDKQKATAALLVRAKITGNNPNIHQWGTSGMKCSKMLW